MIGRRLGSYRVLERLGSGGMGQVFLAEDRSGKRVAIKVLAPELASRPDALARFRREAEIVARLDHPNIVAAHTEQAEGVGELIVMERIEGLALDRYAAAGKLTLAGLLGLARQLAGALGVAHEAGVVHRDLKPGNVLVTPEGAVKILDFGLAKLIAGEGASLTRAGELLGTLPYMAPEQIRGRPVDQRADLFALGVLLYEAVCGQHPFRRDNVASTISAVLGELPPPLAARRPELGADLSRLLERCMEKEPGHRFQTAAELEVALDELARQSDEHTWVLPRPRP